MDPITAIALANASMQLLNVLIPEIQAMIAKGQITNEQQQAILDQYNALKATVAAGGFTGPEWQQSKG